MKTLFIFIIIVCAPLSVIAGQAAALDGPFAQHPSSIEQQKAAVDTLRPPPDMVDVDKEPEVIAKKEPVYPELAVRAGIQGKVWLKIWVDKEGSPRAVEVLKSDAEVLNKSAVDAAWGFRFKPAMVKDKPVDVWVSVPFKFALAPKKSSDSTHAGRQDDLMDFVRNVLEGRLPHADRVAFVVHHEAQAIAGGYLKLLTEALEEQRTGKRTIEDPNRKVADFTAKVDFEGHGGYLVVRTEGSGKGEKPHYHSIIMRREANSDWKIIHWHAWRSSR